MRLLRGQIRQLMDWQQQYLPRTLRKQQPFLTVCRLEQYGKYIINTPTSCKVWLFLRVKCCIEEGFLIGFMIHSKYFPDSDWLKAHA